MLINEVNYYERIQSQYVKFWNFKHFCTLKWIYKKYLAFIYFLYYLLRNLQFYPFCLCMSSYFTIFNEIHHFWDFPIKNIYCANSNTKSFYLIVFGIIKVNNLDLNHYGLIFSIMFDKLNEYKNKINKDEQEIFGDEKCDNFFIIQILNIIFCLNLLYFSKFPL